MSRKAVDPFVASGDATPIPGFTIDGPESRDLDDAVWTDDHSGRPRLWISIAHPDAKISKYSALDIRAREAGFTRYHGGGSTPMLPRYMSEESLSLLPSEPRETLTLILTLDEEFRPIRPQLTRTTTRS